MKSKKISVEDAAPSGPVPIRTSEAVPVSGTWRIICEREGCRSIDDVPLLEGAPGPPCIRCCNPAKLRFLHDEPAKEAPPETAPRPIESLDSIASPAPAAGSIRTREIVPKAGTWSVQCDRCGWNEEKFQHQGAWADPCSRCKSPAVLTFVPEAAPTDPKKNATIEASSSTEVEPATLFERLKLTSKKPGDQKAGTKLGRESGQKKA